MPSLAILSRLQILVIAFNFEHNFQKTKISELFNFLLKFFQFLKTSKFVCDIQF